MTFIYLLAIISFLLWGIAMFFYWRYSNQKVDLRKTLSLEKKKDKQKFSQEMKESIMNLSVKLAPIGQKFKMFINEKDLERKISLAGFPEGMTVSAFMGLRFLFVVVALIFGNLLTLMGLSGILVFIFIGISLFAPTMWIRWLANRRQEQIALDLPDFLDSMSITLQSGTPMEPAMNQTVEGMDGPLHGELTRLIQELNLGVPRNEAYVRLMERNDCPELETLVLSLTQGSKLGVPISETFKVIADDIREARMGKIKEKAAKASPKVTLITSFVILPGVLLCVMGLMILNFIYNPEGIGIPALPF